MSEICREYAEKFISRILNGRLPFELSIGGEKLGDRFGEPSLEGKTALRAAELSGIRATAKLRLLDNAIEFGVTLENTASENSPQLGGIDFLDLELPDAMEKSFGWNHRRVLYSVGSPSTAYDFQPREIDLTRPTELVLTSRDGRASTDWLPYFNCTCDNAEGVIAAIGWSGHWEARFTNGNGCMRLRFTYPADFYLKPSESVELPHVLLMPWRREVDEDLELTDTFIPFRRLMRNQLLPRLGGQPFDGAVCLRAWGRVDEDGHNRRFANMRKFGLRGDAYGVDADWYAIDGSSEGSWFVKVGDWREGDSYPHGIEWLADGGRDAGCDGFWLWFEFERAMSGSAAYKAHPEHYLGGEGFTDHLINMGDPAARDYMRSLIYPVIEKTRMTIFRVDFNIDPGKYFASGDSDRRRGITELYYYNGLYGFFDRMLADFPELVIDNCASGGRRLDYRMCERAVPIMCRSDYWTIPRFEPEGEQAQTLGLARWLPSFGDCNGTCSAPGNVKPDSYVARSTYGASFGIAVPDWELSEAEAVWYKKTIDEAKLVSRYMSLDYYPLTGYSLSKRDWCAFECCEYDGSSAILMAFRRELSRTPEMVFSLRGLNPDSRYELRDLDRGSIGVMTGKALAEGFPVRLESSYSSAIIVLNEVKDS